MKTANEAELTFKVWFSGSEMPGYMPDEPPYPYPSEDAAREALADEIERDIESEWQSSDVNQERIDEMEELRDAIRGGSANHGYAADRYYWLQEDTQTTSELKSADAGELSDYSPVLDEWIDAAELDALQKANFDVEIRECQVRHCDEWRAVRVIDDYGYDGKPWHLGKTVCGAWLYPDAAIRADSFESAYEAWIDERPTIPADEIPEAYGAFDKLVEWMEKRGHENTQHLRDFCNRNAAAFFRLQTSNRDCWDEWPLIEGYQYQSNANGTGIVGTDYDERLDDIPADEIRFRVEL